MCAAVSCPLHVCCSVLSTAQNPATLCVRRNKRNNSTSLQLGSTTNLPTGDIEQCSTSASQLRTNTDVLAYVRQLDDHRKKCELSGRCAACHMLTAFDGTLLLTLAGIKCTRLPQQSTLYLWVLQLMHSPDRLHYMGRLLSTGSSTSSLSATTDVLAVDDAQQPINFAQPINFVACRYSEAAAAATRIKELRVSEAERLRGLLTAAHQAELVELQDNFQQV